MKRITLLACMPLFLIANWHEDLKKYRDLMDEITYDLLTRQQKAHEQGIAPAIADPRIKSIPIKECGEKVVDVRAVNHARIKLMEAESAVKAHRYKEDIDPRSDQHSKMRAGVFKALERMVAELDRLAPKFGYKAGDLQVYLFEGLRDLATQKELFDTKMAAIRKKNPKMTEQEAYAETSKWVSPYINNVPVHSTGAAVDIHMFSKERNAFCDMGRFNTGGVEAPTFSETPEFSPEQRNNRLLFLMAATAAGLTNYSYEFWHFSYGDRYARYWRHDASPAQYGSL